jgi:hypothetical protein
VKGFTATVINISRYHRQRYLSISHSSEYTAGFGIPRVRFLDGNIGDTDLKWD